MKRSSQNFVGLAGAIVLVALVAGSTTIGAQAAQANDWLRLRQQDFARWRAAHANTSANVAKLKIESARRVPPGSLAPSPAEEPAELDSSSTLWSVPGAPTELWDNAAAPRMVIIPAGEYAMGSPATEPDRGPSESPRHRVRIGYAFAVGRFDVTRGEFAQFVAETRYDAKSGGCLDGIVGGTTTLHADSSWERPGFEQTNDDPVVCVNFEDTQAYIRWLSHKTGHAYRLLSEAEWEYAARAGTTTAYYWGADPSVGHANCNGCGSRWDRLQTSPSGSFAPNAFGLYDMTGNVWQWVSDCWNDGYAGAPTDGSSWQAGDCSKHPRRGASFHSHISGGGPPPSSTRYPPPSSTSYARVAMRAFIAASTRQNLYGFRVARDL